MEITVDLHHRRRRTGAKALDRYQSKQIIVGRLTLSNAEPVFQVVGQMIGSKQGTGDIVTDLNQMLPDRMLGEHSIKARRFGNFQYGDTDGFGNFNIDVIVEMPYLMIGDSQGWQDARAFDRIFSGSCTTFATFPGPYRREAL